MSSLFYRPAIDGLRAVAVLAVFWFHLFPEELPGGFLGVDVFFVISGYLITLILLKAEKDGGVFLRNFYQRRVARILPVFAAMGVVTLCAAAVFYSDQDFASAGAVLQAASCWMANVKALLQGNYFELSTDAHPFLHCWSLSVEEQFYALFPLAFVIGRRRLGRGMGQALCLAVAASWALGFLLLGRHPEWAFYLLPTRAWELLAGCVLAVWESDGRSGEGVARCGAVWSRLEWVGWLAMAGPFFWSPPRSPFTPWTALSTVLGTVLVLGSWSRVRGTPAESVSLGRLTAHPVMVSVGRRSFALYLVHWPVFSIVDYAGCVLPSWERTGMKVLLSAAVCELLHRAVEQPLRRVLSRPGNRRICFGAAVGVTLLLAGIGYGIRRTYYVAADQGSVARGGLFFRGPDSGTPKLLLLGDSNASMYGKWLRDFCGRRGWGLTVLSMAACDPLPLDAAGGGELWAALLRVVAEKRPDVVVFACRWSDKLQETPDRLKWALRQLQEDERQILLINEVPDLPPGATRAGIRAGLRPPFFEAEENRKKRARANRWVADSASPRVRVVDSASRFEAQDGSVVFWEGDREILYQDGRHLSEKGVARVEPRLVEAIEEALDAARPVAGGRR
jgi:peptidoglycan/LPS O-acetylase OafA/YrhL